MSRYKLVHNGRGTVLSVDSVNYIAVGPNGENISIRGNGKLIFFDSWEDLVAAIDEKKARYCERDK